MHISTSLSLFFKKQDGTFYSVSEALHKAHQAGFKHVDMCFCLEMDDPKYYLHGQDWERETHRLRELSDALGLVFTQSHLPYVMGGPMSLTGQERERFDEMTRRAMIASGILGAAWGVVHPETPLGYNWAPDKALEQNVEYFRSILEAAHKNNLGIAVENMGDWPRGKWFRMYCSTEYELCGLVDAINDPSVGICWDFGHANMNKLDQALSLRTIGKRLKALHVDDNLGWDDDHMPPFQGTVPWLTVMPVLTEIGYAGDFTFEVNMEKTPESFHVSAARHLHETGAFLLSSAANL
jgi:sugar phosphate isomerase/epimerase